MDFSDQDSLVAALRGQQFLIISLSVTALNIHSDVVKAAAVAGVPYVMPSFFGMDINSPSLAKEPFGAVVAQHLAEMEQLGVSCISLACGTWYEWSLAAGLPFFGLDAVARRATLYDGGATPIHCSTWARCGAAVAALLSLPEAGASPCLADWRDRRAVYVASFVVSQRAMLDSLHRVLGTTDADWEITHETSEQAEAEGLERAARGDLAGRAKAMYAKSFGKYRSGENKIPTDLANEALGLPEESLDDATRTAVEMAQRGWTPYA